VGADLEDDPTAGEGGALALERSGGDAEPPPGADLPAGIESAELSEAVAEVEADR
jgi:hypothetical protein